MSLVMGLCETKVELKDNLYGEVPTATKSTFVPSGEEWQMFGVSMVNQGCSVEIRFC